MKTTIFLLQNNYMNLQDKLTQLGVQHKALNQERDEIVNDTVNHNLVSEGLKDLNMRILGCALEIERVQRLIEESLSRNK